MVFEIFRPLIRQSKDKNGIGCIVKVHAYLQLRCLLWIYSGMVNFRVLNISLSAFVALILGIMSFPTKHQVSIFQPQIAEALTTSS